MCRRLCACLLVVAGSLMVPTGQAAEIQRQFDALSAAERTGLDGALSARTALMERHFVSLEAAAAAKGDAALTVPELRTLLRATRLMQLYQPGEAMTRLQHRWLNVLESRQQTQLEDWRILFEGLIAARHLDEAAALLHRHPTIGLPQPPSIVASAPIPAGRTPILRTDGGGELVREGIDLAEGRWLVVVSHPACSFSNRAAAFISSDESITSMLAREGIQMLWLLPVEMQLDMGRLVAWEHAHPALTVAIAERRLDWPAITEWDTPNVYLFEEGQVAGHFTGWREGEGPHQLRALLAKLQDRLRSPGLR